MNNDHPWNAPITGFTATRQNLPHLQLPGSWYFTASNTHHRIELSPEERGVIMETILHHAGIKYDLDAAVVMPDHFHLILHPKEKAIGGCYSLAEIFHSIKSYTAKVILKNRVEARVDGGAPPPFLSTPESLQVNQKGRRGAALHAVHVFQDENYDHLIRNDKDHIEKLWYLAMNPVEAGLCAKPEEYSYLYCPAMGIG